MKRLWGALVRLTSHQETGLCVGLFRILVALVLVQSVVAVMRADVVDMLWVDVAHGGFRTLGAGSWLLQAMGGPTHAVVGSLLWIALAAGVLLALGIGGPVGGRLVALVCQQCYWAVLSTNPDARGGSDYLIVNALWLLFLADSTASLSVHSRWKTGRWASRGLIYAWPRYLAVLQIVVVYTLTGLQKIGSSWMPWGDFSALYWVYQDPTFLRFPMDWTAHVYPLTQILTVTTWLWETFAFLLLFAYYYRATPGRPGRLRALANRFDIRVPFVAIGVGLHVSIFATLDVGPFSLITLSYYVCLFSARELEQMLSIRRRDTRSPGSRSG